MEQLNYNLLFRWFVCLETDDSVWDATVFSKNRERGEVSLRGSKQTHRDNATTRLNLIPGVQTPALE